jgi:hypothetical protein
MFFLSFRVRAAVFQSLLYEAAGRTINPVSGAVGLLGSGSWHLCQAAVETVLRGGGILPLPELNGGVPGAGAAAGDGRGPFAFTARRAVGCSTFSAAKRVTRVAGRHDADPNAQEPSCDLGLWLSPESPQAPGERWPGTPSMNSEESVTTTTTTTSSGGGREPELLNLFV